MSRLTGYLKSRIRVIILMVLILALFSTSFILFDMEPIVYIYPLILSLAVGGLALAIDFIQYLQKLRTLADRDLPEPSGPLEAEYQSFIQALKEEARAEKICAEENYYNMIEYYTVWAHQIKTPIASMRLQLQNEDSETARRLGGELNRIEGYVEMVMAYLRLDSESTDYKFETYELDDIIRQAVRKFSREFILKKLSLDYQPVGMKVITDEKWLEFVIEQIVSNAVKYTPENGGVRIRSNGPGQLCIEDTGIGICQEDLPRIFENGYTGYNGRTDKRASGIGLYLSKRILDNLGHGICATSDPGQGTCIMINFSNVTDM